MVWKRVGGIYVRDRAEQVFKEPLPFEVSRPLQGFGLGGGGSLWLPINDSELAGWWRADLGTTLVGSKVSVRSDLSNFARPATQSTDANRPTWNASNSNLGGNSSDDFTPLNFLRTADFAVSQPFTVIQIIRNAAVDTRVSFDSATGANFVTLYILTTWRINAGAEIDSGVGGTQNRAIRTRLNGGSSSLALDNWTTPAGSGAAGANPLNGVTIGANRDALGNGFNGSIAETIVTTSNEVILYRQYINRRAYGITVT